MEELIKADEILSRMKVSGDDVMSIAYARSLIKEAYDKYKKMFSEGDEVSG